LNAVPQSAVKFSSLSVAWSVSREPGLPDHPSGDAVRLGEQPGREVGRIDRLIGGAFSC
jgi:hypothetical protein